MLANCFRDDLFPIVYAELRGMARHRLQHEQEAVPATELVHQVYVKLFGGNEQRNVRWESRAHFFGAAARAMEQLLIDAARRKQTCKSSIGEQVVGANAHGNGQDGKATRNGFNLDALAGMTDPGPGDIDVLRLVQALRKLSEQDADLAELVKLRVYLGQTVEGVATTLNTSIRTVHRDWAMARAWLLRRMRVRDKVQVDTDPPRLDGKSGVRAVMET